MTAQPNPNKQGDLIVLKAEQETVIRWDSGAGVVVIDSHHPAVWRRLERAAYQPVRTGALGGREVRRRYEVPRDLFRFRVVPVDRPRRPAPPTAFRAKSAGKTSGRRGSRSAAKGNG